MFEQEDCKVSMKLFINKTSNKVVYAEASNDFVNLLFHVLRLPLGAAMKGHGSLGNVYKSVEDLGVDLLNPGGTKDALLSLIPCAIAPDSASPVPLWMSPPIWPNPKPLFTCSNPISKYHRFGKNAPKTWHVCDVKGNEARCPCCLERLDTSLALSYVAPLGQRSYVKARVPYMVTDDLLVKPLSTFSVVMLFNKLGVKDMGCVEERVVSLDPSQGMALLEASFKSKIVLFDTFIGKN